MPGPGGMLLSFASRVGFIAGMTSITRPSTDGEAGSRARLPINMVIWVTVKTTLDLPDELLIQAKKAAAEQRRPLKSIVEEGLRLVLRGAHKTPRKRQVRLITVKGGLP